MNNLNSLIIEGNIVNDIEVKSANGYAICEFQIAAKRWYKNLNGEPTEEVSIFDISCAGLLAETVGKIGRKGRGVRIVGRLTQVKWFDGDELERGRVVVIAEHIEYKPMLKSVEK